MEGVLQVEGRKDLRFPLAHHDFTNSWEGVCILYAVFLWFLLQPENKVNSMDPSPVRPFWLSTILQLFSPGLPTCEAIITLKEGAQPKKQRAMPMHGERLEALGKIADEWLGAKKVEPGMRSWSSPWFPVATKLKGKWRGVVDMRWVNEQCVEDAHPLPRIDEIMVRQGKSEIFSALDLKDAFHQIPNPKSTQEK